MDKNRIKPKYAQTVMYVLLLVAVVVAMTMARRCSGGDRLAPLSQGNSPGDTIDIAILYGPLSYYIYADTLGGINIDMLRRFEKDTNTPVKLWPIVKLHDAFADLNNGTYDMIASLPADNSVKKNFMTTGSVFLDRLVLVQRADSSGNVRVKSALDLDGDTIRIQRDSPAGSRIGNLSNEIGGNIEVIAEDNLSEEYLCMKVASGDIPLAVVNEKTAKAMKDRYPRLSYDNPVSFTQFQVWVLARGDSALLKKVDGWLSEFENTEAYKDIVSKY